MTYGIQCPSCAVGYGIPMINNTVACAPCPTNCVLCGPYLMYVNSTYVSRCGASVPTTSCGANQLTCVTCATNYTLGAIDYNCYYCPTVVTNCLVNSCS